jgi:predicted transposase/invertase (TIGR01784 family)
MLLGEWNQDEAIEVAREEGEEIGMEKGIKKGMEKEKLIIAKNLLSEGSTPEFVQRITGLPVEDIEKLL